MIASQGLLPPKSPIVNPELLEVALGVLVILASLYLDFLPGTAEGLLPPEEGPELSGAGEFLATALTSLGLELGLGLSLASRTPESGLDQELELLAGARLGVVDVVYEGG